EIDRVVSGGLIIIKERATHYHQYGAPLTYSRLNDVFVRVAQDALVPEQLFDLCAHKIDDHGAENRRHRLKPGARVLHALIPDEVRVRQDKCIVLLERGLDEESERSLLGIEVRVGIDTAGPDKMIHDDRRIRDTYAGVLDERKLPFRPLARIGRVDDLVRNLCDPKPGLEFAA